MGKSRTFVDEERVRAGVWGACSAQRGRPPSAASCDPALPPEAAAVAATTSPSSYRRPRVAVPTRVHRDDLVPARREPRERRGEVGGDRAERAAHADHRRALLLLPGSDHVQVDAVCADLALGAESGGGGGEAAASGGHVRRQRAPEGARGELHRLCSTCLERTPLGMPQEQCPMPIEASK